jgi:menaquinone-dependent protoporphyrinogen oxidase
MKVLVSAASRHGSTDEIAKAIADLLTAAGFHAELCAPEDVTSTAPYDGVVIGSAVYAGRWLEPARKLIERETATLAYKPVWLFSSGPIGDSGKPREEPAEIARLRESAHAIDHHVFSGKLDKSHLGFAERAMLAVVHTGDGDFRSWEDIRAWSLGIAQTLETTLAEKV